MEIGIDSFASAMYGSDVLSSADAMEQLLDRISLADQSVLDIFGIGEHHKKEFLDCTRGHPGCCRCQNKNNPSGQCRYCTEHRGSGTGLSKFCNPGLDLERAG